MAVTGTLTNREICEQALWKAGIVQIGVGATAEEFDLALSDLNNMLKAWQSKGYHLWAYASQSLTLTTAASYTLDPVRPVRIHSARLKRSGIETPMQCMTRQEYDDLPIKTTTGTPTSFYYDRQREAARFYVWPVLAAAAGETVEITYEREIEDVAADDAADFPGEWREAVIYNLAERLCDTFMVEAPMVRRRAVEALDTALSGDREGSVFFYGDG